MRWKPKDLMIVGLCTLLLLVLVELAISELFFLKRGPEPFAILFAARKGASSLFNDRSERQAREKTQIIADNARRGVEAVPAYYFDPHFHPMDREFFPLAGVSRSLTILCNEAGFMSTFTSDRYGFNNEDRAWDLPSKVFLVGDSYTLGSCVNQGDDVASVLRARGINAVSLGVLGAGPLYELAVLKEYCRSDARAVVWLFFAGNDLNNLRAEKGSPVARYLYDRDFSQGLKDRQQEVDQYLRTFFALELDRLKRRGFEPPAQGFPPLDRIEAEDKEIPLLKLILEESGSFLHLRGIERLDLVFFTNSAYDPEIQDLARTSLQRICSELNMGFFDFSRQFSPADYAKLFVGGPYEHFSVAGYARFAEFLASEVIGPISD